MAETSPLPPNLPIPEEVFRTFDPVAQGVILALLEQVRVLTARVNDLEAKLGQNSSNSSKPPSSDPPWSPPVRKPKPPSGRRRGGQKGHPPHQRQLVPDEQVTHTFEHQPAACAHCDRSFVAGEDELLDPVRHQIIDVPQLKPTITEHRLHVRRCRNCQNETVAALPAGVPLCASGPRLQSWVGALTARYRLSKREAQDLLSELLGVVVSLGGVADIEQYLSEAIAAPVAEVREALRQAEVVHHDETGWREANKKSWVWVTATSSYAVYEIHLKRSGEVARSLVDSTQFQGTVVTDRFKSYMCYPMTQRQICHAHLARDYQKMADRRGPGQHIGQSLVEAQRGMFKEYRTFKDGHIDRAAFVVRMEPIKADIHRLLTEGAACDDQKVAGMCNDILQHWPAMWKFVTECGVEPTNNTAEQAIRPLVLWRKGSFGTQSARGSTFMSRMTTVVQTLRRQKRNLINFLVDAVRAWNHGQPAPTLLASAPANSA